MYIYINIKNPDLTPGKILKKKKKLPAGWILPINPNLLVPALDTIQETKMEAATSLKA